jgi:hypothetical protein
MGRNSGRDQQMRALIAQEAARLMAEQGVQDFYVAKRKAAQHLGAPDTRNMPRNMEIEAALAEYQRLFQGETQAGHLRELRESAAKAMRFLEQFSPRLVGAVLTGSAGRHASVDLHLFADAVEEISFFLMEAGIPFQTSQKRMRIGKEEWQDFPSFHFLAGEHAVDLVVFPREGRRDAPRSPVDGRPMARAALQQVEALLE